MRVKEVLAIGICLGGLLSNTSVYNFESFGIPLFYPLVLLLGVICVFLNKGKLRTNRSLLLMIITCFVCMIIPLPFHSPEVWGLEIKQIVARSMFLLYLALSYHFIVRYRLTDYLIRITKAVLIFAFVNGVYEFVAKNFGLPNFFGFVANSASFTVVDNSMGWIQIGRARSFWSEPSFSTFPLILMIYFILLENSTRKKYFNILIISFYSVLTVSRSVFFVYLLGMLLLLYQKVILFININYLERLLLRTRAIWTIGIAIVAVFLSGWVFFASYFFDDMSSSVRSVGVYIGYRIWFDNLVFGTGFSTYPMYEAAYSSFLPEGFTYIKVKYSLGMFSSLGQQLGIFGIVYALAPLVYMFNIRSLIIWERVFVVTLALLIGIIQSDVTYFTSFWFLVLVVSLRGEQSHNQS